MEKIPENTNNKNISNGIKDHNIKKNNIREAPKSPEDEKSEAEFDFSDSDLIESDENDETNNEESNNNNNKNSFSNKLQNQSVMTNATIQTNKTAAPPDAEAINELVNSNNHTMTSDSINSPTTETNNNNNVNITNTNELNPNNKINVSIDKENINNNEILSNKKRNSSSVYLNETNCDPVNENFNDNGESNLKRPSNLDLEHLNNNNDDDDEDNDDDCYNDHSIDADILASPPPFIIKNTSSSHLSTIETNNNRKDLNTIDDNNKLMEPFCPIPTTPKKFVDSMDNDDEYDENNIISNGRKFFPKNMNNSSGKLKADLSQETNINNNNNSNKDEDQNRNIIKSTYSIGHGDGGGGGGGGNCGNIEDDEVFYSGEDDYNEDDDDYDDENEDEDKIIIEFLGKANPFAEARLAARRQARAEAREIRMRELERQQKEMDQNADRAYDMQTSAGIDPLARSRLTVVGNHVGGSIGNNTSHLRTPNSGGSMSSRRSSEDSLEDEGRSIRDIRHELKDLEERFRKAMIANAQLDNERTSHTYQIELLKDQLEEKGEKYAQLQREYKEKSRESNALKRNVDKLEEELRLVKGQLDERDSLISEQGLVIVLIENEDGTDAKRALVSVENAQLLGSVQGSLDVRLKRFTEEKHQLQKEVQTLQQQVDELKSQGRGKSSMNGPLGIDDEYEAQREANKLISEFKYKLQKAEQEIASLQASLARSETQVIRYKSTAEAAEKAEAELKIERRKLQRENREASERLEELETSNNHLLKRLDKLKTAKSTLLKEL